jgi:TM2 domain-containing membrane protein YozV
MKKYIFAVILIAIALTSSLLAADYPGKDHSAHASSCGMCLASQNPGLLQSNVINYSQGQSGGGEKYYPKYKSESTATMLAVFPGFFVHGLGHFYAGSYGTAMILFGLEMLVVPGTLAEISYALAENRDDEKSDAYTAAFIVSIAAFLGSWIYDLAHADIAVRKYNDRVRAQIYYSSEHGNDIKVGLALRF